MMGSLQVQVWESFHEQEVATVGLHLAKNVFEVHAIALDGEALIRRKLRRSEVIRFFADLPP
ncbi:MAG: hypothetical protein KDE55_03960 [Novosphingobium sp.]|nr:hypothetical protein [Novosphingobium sp.]